eukprot:1158937-Pelagomonas_calceolata.AAC.8
MPSTSSAPSSSSSCCSRSAPKLKTWELEGGSTWSVGRSGGWEGIACNRFLWYTPDGTLERSLSEEGGMGNPRRKRKHR